jgi:hypothetical protein
MDKSVDNSVLEIAILHLFTKHKSPNQHLKLMPILAFRLAPLLSFSPLSLFPLFFYLLPILLLLYLLLLLLPLYLLLFLLFLPLFYRPFADNDPIGI